MVLVQQPKRPHTIHHKRRTGTHHKRTPDYNKTYWPYLPLAALVGLGMLVNTLWPTLQNILGYATNMSLSGLLQSTNEQRSAENLASLTLNEKLNAAAQSKANDMAARNYWSHNTPEGQEPWVFFDNAGYAYLAAGENLAYGFSTSDAAVVAWMNSPGHRANIMNGQFKEVGFGVANVPNYQDSGEQTIVVAMYGNPVVASATTPVQPQPAQQAPAPTPTPAPEQNVPAATPDVVSAAPLQTADTSQHVARIQLITDGFAPWSLFAISAVAFAALGAFIIRHGRFWHRAIRKGEKFIIHHPVLDFALVAIVVVGFVLTRSAGLIY